MGFSLRIYRFLYIFLGYISGFLGISIGLFIHLLILSSIKSFGVSYLSPYIPITKSKSSLSYFLKPISNRKKRADFLKTKRINAQGKISKVWKFLKGN